MIYNWNNKSVLKISFGATVGANPRVSPRRSTIGTPTPKISFKDENEIPAPIEVETN